MTDLIERCTNGLPLQATRLEEALGADERETIRRVAHQLKGAARGYGYPTITAAAARLEQQAREGETLVPPRESAFPRRESMRVHVNAA